MDVQDPAKTGPRQFRRADGDVVESMEARTRQRFSRMVAWIPRRKGRKVRLALGVFLVVGGMLGLVLPVAGIWMIPLGLLVLAEDVPRLRGPAAWITGWLEAQWTRVRTWLERHTPGA